MKSQWRAEVTPAMEYDIFQGSDDHGWQDVTGHYWGLHAAGDTPLGTADERLCKFPRTRNPRDPWHGYPVLTADEAPLDPFVEMWLSTGVITRTTARRIQRRKL